MYVVARWLSAALAVLGTGNLTAQVPSPVEFLGHEVGADYQLCNYTDLVRYFRAVEQASDRVKLVDIGETSYGQRMVMAVITSPQNQARLERLRQISHALCHAENGDAAAAAALAEEGRAVIWVDAGLHATEAIAGQNIIELVWQMASRDDAEVRRILDEVVLLACPVNPDGLELIANAYRATRSMTIPVLYQRYIGHDNNRDFYACNQKEAQNVSRVFYHEWCPQIVYNHHQTAPGGTIIFTPPFRDPFNYNVDPLVVRGIDIVSAHINHRFTAEGKPGVISRSGASYSTWWNGGLRTTTYFHNMIGILTEVFGRPEPTKITQTLSRRLPNGDYPDPVPTQTWHARQTIEYLQTANFAILDYAARHRRELLTQIWTMGRRQIDKGSRDHWTVTPPLMAAAELREEPDSVFTDPLLRDPRAYVLRKDQRDWGAALRFVRALRRCGIDVLRATAAFEVNGITAPAGSFVVKTAQAFRPHVIDMFEPQWHPDDVRDGKPVPPYDSAGWTLAMQMGVQVERCFEALDGPFENWPHVESFTGVEEVYGGMGPRDSTWHLDPANIETARVVSQLLTAGARVEWSPRGFYAVPNDSRAAAAVAAKKALWDYEGKLVQADTREARQRVTSPRLGLFDTFGGHMPTGWTQWLLTEFDFPVQQVWGDRIEAGDLGKDYDVLVFHTGLPGTRDLQRAARRRQPPDYEKLRAALPPFEDWSDIEARDTALTGEKSLPALREFVAQGGTLIALAGECDKVIRHFDLPLRVGTYVPVEGEEERRTQREEFYVPGSLLAIDVDTQHPIGRGSAPTLAAMFRNGSEVLEVTGAAPSVEVVARYRGDDTLLSGWAIGTEHLVGKAAVVCARVGKGRVVLFGNDAIYRGQPLGTTRLLFNAILTARESR